MSIISGLFTSFKNRSKAKSEITNTFLRAIDDNILTEEEINRIKTMRVELGVDDKGWSKIQDHLYEITLNKITQDNRLSPTEDALLTQLLTHFTISDKIKNNSRIDLIRFKLLHTIESGELPIINAPGISLQKNELVHWIEPVNMLEEKTNRSYVGGSKGVSVRVAKGVSFRAGGFRGHVVTNQEIVPVSSGELVITNRRIVFRGDRKNFTAKWPKVIDLDFYSDGLKIGTEGRQKPVLFKINTVANTEIVAMICSNLLNYEDEK